MANRAGSAVLEILIIIGLIGLLVSGMSDNSEQNSQANTAEAKANLHSIQISCERFSVDTDGVYPAYLTGGEARYASVVDAALAGEAAFTGIVEYASREAVSDPLLRLGYLDAYPANPFIASGAAVHRIQANLPSALGGCDPLRNGGDGAGAQGAGTRFGARCNLMGNVYADPRYPAFIARDSQTGALVNRDTWATVEYEFWDLWTGDQPQPFLPGMFLYKGAGALRVDWPEGQPPPADPSATSPREPLGTQYYLLACFGGLQEKGKDIVGDERPVVYRRPGPAGGAEQALAVWSWTRSEVSQDPSAVGGCPYSPNPELGAAAGANDLHYGNPNGIRDAIALVLTAGERFEDER